MARTLRIGGVSKPALLTALQHAGVRLNAAALALFADERFTTAATSSLLLVVERSVGSLGLPEGGTFEQVLEHASSQHGLRPCPLEAGPHLRLQALDQAEGFVGQPPSCHRAPPGSLTVVSLPLATDDETPRGFYLRRIDGSLWLRGYRSSADHVWQPEDRLVFLSGDVA